MTSLTGAPPPVIAAVDLQRDPQGVLRALCNRLGLEHLPDALSWQAHQPKQWDGWKHWHHEVAQSTGIQSQQTNYVDTVDNNSTLAAFYRHHEPFHDEMHLHRIVPGT